MGDGGSGEKTEEPTPERLRKLREDGNVPKSQDVTSAASFLVVFVTIGRTFVYSSGQLTGFLLESITVASNVHGDRSPFLVQPVLLEALAVMAKCIAPAMGAALVTGLAINFAQVGFLFTTKPITPDFNKINPINGLKGLFNMKKVVELLKTIVKFILIAYLSWYALRKSLRDVTLILRSDLFVGVKIVGGIVADFVLKIGMVFFLIAAADLFYQRRRYIKDNRMTKYDIKQEYKQSEGDPHHKSERRRLHQEILQGGGGSAVKGADVVVRNPNHIAVALKYDKDKKGAPKILAKGERLWAEKILDAAKEYGIPVVRNVPLAQALNKMDVGDEIPEELYQAVAEVLTFVYSLSQEQQKKKGRK
jgi:flagellar biosynthetic protein FlhB